MDNVTHLNEVLTSWYNDDDNYIKEVSAESFVKCKEFVKLLPGAAYKRRERPDEKDQILKPERQGRNPQTGELVKIPGGSGADRMLSRGISSILQERFTWKKSGIESEQPQNNMSRFSIEFHAKNKQDGSICYEVIIYFISEGPLEEFFSKESGDALIDVLRQL